MGFLVHRRLAMPLSAIALFAIALAAPAGATLLLMPATTVFVVAALGITAITFLTSGAIPSLRPSPSSRRSSCGGGMNPARACPRAFRKHSDDESCCEHCSVQRRHPLAELAGARC
jgi:hypothetical protein